MTSRSIRNRWGLLVGDDWLEDSLPAQVSGPYAPDGIGMAAHAQPREDAAHDPKAINARILKTAKEAKRGNPFDDATPVPLQLES